MDLRTRVARRLCWADGEIPDAGMYHPTIKGGRHKWEEYLQMADAAINEIETATGANLNRP